MYCVVFCLFLRKDCRKGNDSALLSVCGMSNLLSKIATRRAYSFEVGISWSPIFIEYASTEVMPERLTR